MEESSVYSDHNYWRTSPRDLHFGDLSEVETSSKGMTKSRSMHWGFNQPEVENFVSMQKSVSFSEDLNAVVGSNLRKRHMGTSQMAFNSDEEEDKFMSVDNLWSTMSTDSEDEFFYDAISDTIKQRDTISKSEMNLVRNLQGNDLLVSRQSLLSKHRSTIELSGAHSEESHVDESPVSPTGINKRITGKGLISWMQSSPEAACSFFLSHGFITRADNPGTEWETSGEYRLSSKAEAWPPQTPFRPSKTVHEMEMVAAEREFSERLRKIEEQHTEEIRNLTTQNSANQDRMKSEILRLQTRLQQNSNALLRLEDEKKELEKMKRHIEESRITHSAVPQIVALLDQLNESLRKTTQVSNHPDITELLSPMRTTNNDYSSLPRNFKQKRFKDESSNSEPSDSHTKEKKSPLSKTSVESIAKGIASCKISSGDSSPLANESTVKSKLPIPKSLNFINDLEKIPANASVPKSCPQNTVPISTSSSSTKSHPPPPPPPSLSGIPPPPPLPGFGSGVPPPPPLPGSGIPPPPPLPGTGIPPPPPFPGIGGGVPPPPPIPGGVPPPPGFPTAMKPVPARVAMKALYWQPINLNRIAKSDSLWDHLPSATDQLNQAEIENLFARETSKQRSSLESKYATVSKGRKVVKVIAEKRSQAVGILMSGLHVSVGDIAAMIYKMEGDALDRDSLRALLDAQASPEELALIKNVKAVESLDKPERFLLDLAGLECFSERAFCIVSRAEITEMLSELQKKMTLLCEVCTALKTWESLRHLMALVLAVGNYLNAGNKARGSAAAFALDILPKLKDMKTRDGRSTLLAYIVKVFLSSKEDANLPLPEPDALTQASQISLDDLTSDLKLIEFELQKAQESYDRVLAETTRSPVEPFKSNLAKFFTPVKKDVEACSEKLDLSFNKYNDLLKFFCVASDSKPTLAEFFTIWVQFSRDLKAAWRLEQMRLTKQKLKEATKRVSEIKQKQKAAKECATTVTKKSGGLKAKLKNAPKT